MIKPMVICIGTRPEIIKMAPVYLSMRDAGLPAIVLHTGQHQDMAWPLYEFFNIKPALTIDLARSGEGLADLSAALLAQIGTALSKLAPGLVLVHGDTSSALMGALAAFYQQIPVAHVEAGLRTHQDYSPFPEEKNRQLLARLARWNFAPTPQAESNLLREGVAKETVYMVGNTIVDATLWAVRQLDQMEKRQEEVLPPSLHALTTLPRTAQLLLVTAHRRENWNTGISGIAEAVKELLLREPNLVAAWPVHANARVRNAVEHVFADLPEDVGSRLYLCAPLNYPALLWLLKKAWLVLTDSGGIQEEAAALKKPVLVLRESTERPELIQSGLGMLVGSNRGRIVAATRLLHADSRAYAGMRGGANPFGDGRAAKRIATILGRYVAPAGQKPERKIGHPSLALGEASC